MTLAEEFGQVDIYVFDQLLRGNLHAGQRLLDAGCGGGRNLVYLPRQGAEIFGVDRSGEAVAHVRAMAGVLQPRLPGGNFQVAELEALPFAEASFDAVLCNSVLHFARDGEHFRAMVAELWRVLRPGGLLFCRLGSRIGMEFEPVRPGIYRVGDGQEWYLVDERELMELTQSLGAEMVDALKTTVVQAHRCMTTWVVRRPGKIWDRGLESEFPVLAGI